MCLAMERSKHKDIDREYRSVFLGGIDLTKYKLGVSSTLQEHITKNQNVYELLYAAQNKPLPDLSNLHYSKLNKKKVYTDLKSTEKDDEIIPKKEYVSAEKSTISETPSGNSETNAIENNNDNYKRAYQVSRPLDIHSQQQLQIQQPYYSQQLPPYTQVQPVQNTQQLQTSLIAPNNVAVYVTEYTDQRLSNPPILTPTLHPMNNFNQAYQPLIGTGNKYPYSSIQQPQVATSHIDIKQENTMDLFEQHTHYQQQFTQQVQSQSQIIRSYQQVEPQKYSQSRVSADLEQNVLQSDFNVGSHIPKVLQYNDHYSNSNNGIINGSNIDNDDNNNNNNNNNNNSDNNNNSNSNNNNTNNNNSNNNNNNKNNNKNKNNKLKSITSSDGNSSASRCNSRTTNLQPGNNANINQNVLDFSPKTPFVNGINFYNKFNQLVFFEFDASLYGKFFINNTYLKMTETDDTSPVACYRRNFNSILMSIYFSDEPMFLEINGTIYDVEDIKLVLDATSNFSNSSVDLIYHPTAENNKELSTLTIMNDSVLNLGVFKGRKNIKMRRFQFKKATPNNGKYIAKDYYYLILKLEVRLKETMQDMSGKRKPSFTENIMILQSNGISVRGRNPSFYTERNDEILDKETSTCFTIFDSQLQAGNIW